MTPQIDRASEDTDSSVHKVTWLLRVVKISCAFAAVILIYVFTIMSQLDEISSTPSSKLSESIYKVIATSKTDATDPLAKEIQAVLEASSNARPTELSQANSKILGGIALNLMSAIIGTGASFLFLSLLFKKHEHEEVARRIFAQFRRFKIFENIASNMSTISNGGVIAVLDPKNGYMDEVRDKMSEAADGQDIIIIDNWLCQDMTHITLALELGVARALEKGAIVTLILMHPNSPLVRRREHFLPKPSVKDDIKGSMAPLRRMQDSWTAKCKLDSGKQQNRFRVYFADTYLSMQLYSLPGTSYAGFYAAHETSTHCPHLKVVDDSILGKMYKSYAEHLKELCTRGSNCAVRAKFDDQDIFEGVLLSEISDHVLPIQVADLALGTDSLAVHDFEGVALAQLASKLLRQLMNKKTTVMQQVLESISTTDKQTLKSLLDNPPVIGVGKSVSQPLKIDNENKTASIIREVHGVWYGVHRTRQENGDHIDSVHEYMIDDAEECNEDGDCKISGTFKEMSPRLQGYNFRLNGWTDSVEMVLIARRLHETSVALLRIGYGSSSEDGTLIGMYLYHDFGGRLVSTPIVLTRKEKTAAEGYQIIRSHKSFHDHCFLEVPEP